MTLEDEAEEYVYKSIQRDDYYCSGMEEGFIAGYNACANSNYAKQQVIKGKIEVVQEILDADYTYTKIKQLLAELKQLETPKI